MSEAVFMAVYVIDIAVIATIALWQIFGPVKCVIGQFERAVQQTDRLSDKHIYRMYKGLRSKDDATRATAMSYIQRYRSNLYFEMATSRIMQPH